MLEQSLIDRVMPRLSRYDKFEQKIRLSHLRYTDDGYLVTQRPVNDRKYFSITDYAKETLLQKTGIPKTYFNKVEERNKKLATEMMNDSLLSNKEYYTIKFMDDHVRGIIDSNIKTLSDIDMITAVQQGMADNDYELRSLHIDHNGLFLKLLFKDSFKDTSVYAKTTSLRGGITIVNSDNLYSDTSVKPFLFRQVCTNDATMISDKSFTLKNSQGFNFDDISYKISSLVSFAILNSEGYVKTALDLNSLMIPRDRVKHIIENICNEHNLSVNETKQVIVSYMKEPMNTAFGVVNSFTDCAKNYETTDLYKKEKLENIGGYYINLDKNEWKELIKVA